MRKIKLHYADITGSGVNLATSHLYQAIYSAEKKDDTFWLLLK